MNRLKLTTCLIVLALLAPLVQAQRPDDEEAQGSKNIRSLRAIRDEDVVRQKWDISFGAAAPRTLLTYDFKDNTPETALYAPGKLVDLSFGVGLTPDTPYQFSVGPPFRVSLWKPAAKTI